MLTHEEIKKIARLFAEETSNGDSLDPHTDFAEEYAVKVLQWLCKTHCIVEKDEIKSDYNSNTLAAGQFAKGSGAICAQMREWHQGKCDELISLFGKELFNEQKL